MLAHCLERILCWDVQVVLLGSGDAEAEHFFAWSLARSAGDRFRAWLGFDDGRAHRIEAGADFFVMPSRFEPCGLNQMYSLRYGTLPIVRDDRRPGRHRPQLRRGDGRRHRLRLPAT